MERNTSPDFNNHWFKIVSKLLLESGVVINGSKKWDIKVKNKNFYKRVLQQGSLGLGESYMDGWWDCDNIDMLIDILLRTNIESKVPLNVKDMIRVAGARLVNLQTPKRAWIVGKEHYDLGNDLFSEMLDPFMQYSCGYWKDAETLEEAQVNKLKLICEKLNLQKGMSLLDIGCGWGGLAEYAARNYGVDVTGITISVEQKIMAEKRCEGLNAKFILEDYRDLKGRYDRIVSVGMFEHVGPKNYRTYFKVTNNCLKEDGIFLLHTIGSNISDLNVDPWINKYIFPNGCLPSLSQIFESAQKYYVTEDLHNFGADYDKTLISWHERFEESYPELSRKYTERFRRMFTYYLCACAGAFRARNIQLWQVVFTKGIKGGLRVAR
ncbi:cyclopropane fatty acyl phospholipid synthase (plasmid) [Klebsiella oxytoca]|uniref:cyclopropane fatty acyl phospholipid synthase n=1 Tax=Klebsiella oxytoca TaxID=571 RepID=UPI0039824E5B